MADLSIPFPTYDDLYWELTRIAETDYKSEDSNRNHRAFAKSHRRMQWFITKTLNEQHRHYFIMKELFDLPRQVLAFTIGLWIAKTLGWI